MRISENYTITEELVNKFSEISGDRNPIHIDEDFAKKSIFGKKISHGMLLASFISSVIANKYPGIGSIYLSQNLEFKNPCFINDTVTVDIELIKQEKNKYYLKTNILRDNIVLIEGNALVLNNKKL